MKKRFTCDECGALMEQPANEITYWKVYAIKGGSIFYNINFTRSDKEGRPYFLCKDCMKAALNRALKVLEGE